MRLFAVLLIFLFFVACDSSESPEPIVEDPEFIIGDLENETASYFTVNEQITVPTTTTEVEHSFDIDNDGIDDLRISITTSAEDFMEEVWILPLNGLSISKLDWGMFKGEETSIVSGRAEGTVLIAEEIDWSTGRLLFAYRIRNTGLFPYSLSFDQAFLPLLKNGKTGWISYYIEVDESRGIALSKIGFDTFCLDQE